MILSENTKEEQIEKISFKTDRLLKNKKYRVVITYIDAHNETHSRIVQQGIVKHSNDVITIDIESSIMSKIKVFNPELHFQVFPGNSSKPVLVRAWQYQKQSWFCDKSVAPYPSRMIGFNLTNQCNLRCRMCWQLDRKKIIQLSPDVIKKVLDSVKLIGRPPVYLWGGEPFLHPEIWNIIKMVKNTGFFCLINTNGYFIQKYVKEILDSKLDFLIVSIDGNEKIHDQVRNSRGLFKKIMEGLTTLQNLKTKRPIVVINCVVTDLSYLILEEVIAIKESIDADFLEFQFLIYYTDTEKKKYKDQFKGFFGYEPGSIDSYPGDFNSIDLEKLIKVMKSIKAKNDSTIRFYPYILNNEDKVSNYFYSPGTLHRNSCESLTKTCWVEPNGNVVPCSIFPDYSAGNIYTDDFYEIWNGEKYREFRKKMTHSLFSICSRCCDMYKTDFFQKENF